MGIWSSIWEFFSGIFSKLFSGNSREDEEKEELKDYLRSRRLTKREIHEEEIEARIEHKLAEEFNKIGDELSKDELATEIRLRKRMVTVQEALFVLSANVQKFIDAKTSLEDEVNSLNNILSFWRVLRQGLLSLETKKDINKVDLLFKELGIILKDEEKISWQKIELVRKEYDLIMKEEGTKRGQQPRNKEPVAA